MKRPARHRAEAKALRQSIMLPLGVGALLLIGVVMFYQVGTRVPETDNRLCPKATGPVGATVLLLDTSDPLTPKHRAELDRLAGQVASEHVGRMGIAPQELFAVYELTQDPGAPKQLIEVCRPLKSLKDRTWRDDIHQGRRFAERDWERFEDALVNAFPGTRKRIAADFAPARNDRGSCRPPRARQARGRTVQGPSRRLLRSTAAHPTVLALRTLSGRQGHAPPRPRSPHGSDGCTSEPLPARTAQICEVAERTSLLLVD